MSPCSLMPVSDSLQQGFEGLFPAWLFVTVCNVLKALVTLYQDVQCCVFPQQHQCGYGQDALTVAGKTIVQNKIPVDPETSESPGSAAGLWMC